MPHASTPDEMVPPLNPKRQTVNAAKLLPMSLAVGIVPEQRPSSSYVNLMASQYGLPEEYHSGLYRQHHAVARPKQPYPTEQMVHRKPVPLSINTNVTSKPPLPPRMDHRMLEDRKAQEFREEVMAGLSAVISKHQSEILNHETMVRVDAPKISRQQYGQRDWRHTTQGPVMSSAKNDRSSLQEKHPLFIQEHQREVSSDEIADQTDTRNSEQHLLVGPTKKMAITTPLTSRTPNEKFPLFIPNQQQKQSDSDRINESNARDHTRLFIHPTASNIITPPPTSLLPSQNPPNPPNPPLPSQPIPSPPETPFIAPQLQPAQSWYFEDSDADQPTDSPHSNSIQPATATASALAPFTDLTREQRTRLKWDRIRLALRVDSDSEDDDSTEVVVKPSSSSLSRPSISSQRSLDLPQWRHLSQCLFPTDLAHLSQDEVVEVVLREQERERNAR
ncbi:hypothetical protein MMC20_005727 [Loxospora ochrophaea]|nr:hypothetical protein [Loxospora ochrophaea]